MTKNQSGFTHPILLALFILVLAVIGIAGWRVLKSDKSNGYEGNLSVRTNSIKEAEDQGKKYSQNTCHGTDIKKLDHLPIDADAITRVLPYGDVVGAHIMPISHAYIWPGEFGGPRDKYKVYAMADSTIYNINSRSINVDKGTAKPTEYGIQFSVSCTEFYYYDLMTSLTPQLQKYLDEHPSGSSAGNSVNVNIPVKSGQPLGYIGGQTLDYAVWDFTKNLSGIIEPSHYEADFPRIHLVDPFDYVTDDVKEVLVEKNIRTADPAAGKVDYDIDARLVGGWFEENTKFYEGLNQGRYWAGHLAIVPNSTDPTMYMVSIGTWGSNEVGQFAISRDAPDPRTVGVTSGTTKYDLYYVDFNQADGTHWDRMSFAKGLHAITNQPSKGCAVFRLTEKRKLKAEFFSGQACVQTSGFTASAKNYTR